MVPRMGPEEVTIVGVGVEDVVRGRGREREQTKRARAQASCSDTPRASMALLFVWGLWGCNHAPKEPRRHRSCRVQNHRDTHSTGQNHARSFPSHSHMPSPSPQQLQLQARAAPQACARARLHHTFICVIVS